VGHLRETVSAPNGNLREEPSFRTPENIECVSQAFVTCPRRSATINAIALKMPDRAVRRILHEDLNFHPHKMVMVRAISN
jgi:hypothetical protein